MPGIAGLDDAADVTARMPGSFPSDDGDRFAAAIGEEAGIGRTPSARGGATDERQLGVPAADATATGGNAGGEARIAEAPIDHGESGTEASEAGAAPSGHGAEEPGEVVRPESKGKRRAVEEPVAGTVAAVAGPSGGEASRDVGLEAAGALRPDQSGLVTRAQTTLANQKKDLEEVVTDGYADGASRMQRQNAHQAQTILNHIQGAQNDFENASRQALAKSGGSPADREEASADMQKAVTEYNIQASRITGNASKLVGASSTLGIRQQSVEIAGQSRSISKQALYLSAGAGAVSLGAIIPSSISAAKNSGSDGDKTGQ